jgi:hypothetical protein
VGAVTPLVVVGFTAVLLIYIDKLKNKKKNIDKRYKIKEEKR